MKTKFPTELEKAVHAVLTIRGRRIKEAPGTEWFLTTPGEFDEIVASLLKA